jgi:excisionase family DNA binding protein
MENPFEIIIEKLNSIETLLKKPILNSNTELQNSTVDEIMDLEQVAKYIKLAKATIYGLTSSRKIPHFKRTKRLYFKKSEIEAWLTEHKIKTMEEIEKEAMNYIVRKDKRYK